MWLRDARPVLILGGMYAAGVAALLLRDPYANTWSACPFLALTGVPCPLCGGLRATYSAVTGDLASAWASNPLATVLVFITPLLVGYAVTGWAVQRRRHHRTLQGVPASESDTHVKDMSTRS